MTIDLTVFKTAYVFSGFCVGALVGITGVAGGAVMVPILILFGFSPSTAVGTDLLYAALTKTSGTIAHGYTKTVDWVIVSRLAMGSLPAAALALLVLFYLHANSVAAQLVVTRVLGIALLLTALSLFFRLQLVRFYADYVGELPERTVRRLTIASGVLLGTLVTISSVGAGALGVTFLIMLYPRHNMARIVGSDIAHAVPLMLIAGLGHLALGAIDWPLLGVLLLGSIPGIVIGSLLSSRLPDRAVRLTMGCVLITASAKMLVY